MAAINQGEVVTLTATFAAAPPEPVEVWVRRFSGTVDGPFTMDVDGTVASYDYTTAEPRTHQWFAKTAAPAAIEYGQFYVRPPAFTP